MVSLSIFTGNVTVSGLKIANPTGYKFEHVLEANSISVTTSIGGLLSNPVEIKTITIDGLTMVIEQKGMTNNISDILKAMPKPRQAETNTAEPAKNGKSVHIASVDMTNIGITAKLLPLPGKSGALTLKIPSLHLSNLGGNKSSLGEVIGKIFAAISAEIAAKGAGILPSDMTGSIQDAGKTLESATENIKGLLKPSSKDANSSNTQDMGNKLKGLFDKKKK
jgi:hypothetical protein